MNRSTLIIPNYFDINKMEGSLLKKITLSENWLDDLRNIFSEDKNLFFLIRDEMLLRDFKFPKEVQSNYFPPSKVTTNNYIHVTDDSQRYLKINNILTNIELLIRRFKINSDLFFNYISVEALANYIQKDSKIILFELEKAGFEIINKDKINEYDEIATTINNDNEQKALEINVNENDSYPLSIGDQKVKEVGPDLIVNSHGINTIENFLIINHIDFTLFQKNLTIKEVFYQTKYTSFTKFCKEEKISYLSELDIDLLNKFRQRKGVGISKFKDVINKLEDLQKNHKPNTPPSSLEIISNVINKFCNNQLKETLELNDINYLDFLDEFYDENFEQLYEQRIQKIKNDYPKLKKLAEEKLDRQRIEKAKEEIYHSESFKILAKFSWNSLKIILKVPDNKLSLIDGNAHLYEILQNEEYDNYLPKINFYFKKYVPINVTLTNLSEEITDRDFIIVKLRGLGETLATVGEKLEITRERVRQVEKKVSRKITYVLEKVKIEEYLRNMYQEKGYVLVKDFIATITEDAKNQIILNYYLNNNLKFVIKNDYVFDRELNDYLERSLVNYNLKTKDIVIAEILLKEINAESKYEINIDRLDVLMEENNFYRWKDIYIKNSVSYTTLLEYLFKYKINGPLEMTDSNFEYLSKLFNETFNRTFDSGKRSVVSRMRDVKNLILVDSNTFYYYDLDTVASELIEEISIILNEYFETSDVINANKIYLDHKKIWHKSGIVSHLFLYSIIKYYFSDQYSIGRGNTLTISKLGYESITRDQQLQRLLLNNGSSMSKEEIANKLHWPTYTVEQTIAKNNNDYFPILLENGKLGVKLISSYNFTNEELIKIRDFANEFINMNYIFTQDLMIEMEFDNDISQILAEKNIINLYDFSSLIKYLIPDLRGFHQFLYFKDSEIRCIEQAIFAEFEGILERAKLIEFLVEKGYSETTYSAIHADLTSMKYFYPYTATKLINSKNLHISSEIITAVNNYLDDVLSDKDFISVYDLTGFSNLPPISEHAWTTHLVCAIAEEIGYQLINTTRDYRYNKLLLINKRLNLKTIDELAHYLIKENYKGNYHESDIAEFLYENKLLHTPNLSIGIKTSTLFNFKEFGFIELKE